MLKMAREIALNHHERWDGKGYPRGLAGKSIPESARIVAIVDCLRRIDARSGESAAISGRRGRGHHAEGERKTVRPRPAGRVLSASARDASPGRPASGRQR